MVTLSREVRWALAILIIALSASYAEAENRITDTKQLVLDLLVKTVREAKNNALASPETMEKALGIKMQVKAYEIQAPQDPSNPKSPLANYSGLNSTQITTGIAALDEVRGARYTVRISPAGGYLFRLGKLEDVVCISMAEVEQLFGKPEKLYSAPHGRRNFAGSHEYSLSTSDGFASVGFLYIRTEQGRECLEMFSVGQRRAER